jgi:hypothetical protein
VFASERARERARERIIRWGEAKFKLEYSVVVVVAAAPAAAAIINNLDIPLNSLMNRNIKEKIF